MTTLLHVFSPDTHYRPYQRETWAALEAIEPALVARGWEVLHVATPADGTYERAVKELWGKDDLIALEHDLVPSLDVLLALAGCSHDLCTQCYRLHYLHAEDGVAAWVRSKLPEIDEAGRALIERAGFSFVMNTNDTRRRHIRGQCWEPFCHRVIEEDGLCRWGEEEDDFADLAGLGCTKISRAFQQAHAPDWKTDGSWGDLDGRISVWVRESGFGRWHVHRPTIPHNHPCAAGVWIGDLNGFVQINQPEESESIALELGAPRANQIDFEVAQFEPLVRFLRPRTVLEIGVDQGGTLARWALAADPQALLVGVDLAVPPNAPHRQGQTVRLIEGDSHDPDTLRKVRAALGDRPVDFLFIDGDHRGAVADFRDYAPLVAPGGLIGFHDIQPGPRENVGTVPEDWKAIRSGRHYREIIANPVDQAGYGIGVIFVPKEPAAVAAWEA